MHNNKKTKVYRYITYLPHALAYNANLQVGGYKRKS